MSAQSETVRRSPLVSRTETVKPDPFRAAGAGSSGAGLGGNRVDDGSGGLRREEVVLEIVGHLAVRLREGLGCDRLGGEGRDRLRCGRRFVGRRRRLELRGRSGRVERRGGLEHGLRLGLGVGLRFDCGRGVVLQALPPRTRALPPRRRAPARAPRRRAPARAPRRRAPARAPRRRAPARAPRRRAPARAPRRRLQLGHLEDRLGIGFRLRLRFGLRLGLVGRKRRLLGRGRNAGVDTQRGRVELGLELRLGRGVDRRLGGGGYGAESSGIRLADHLVELGPTRDDEAHVLAEGLADVPVEDVVRRVGDRDEREALLESDRQRAEEPRLILAQEPRRLGIDQLGAQADERKPLLAGEETREVLFLQKAALDEDLAEPPTRLHALFEGVFDRFRGQESSAEDQGSKGGVRTFSQRSAHRPQFTCWARVSALFRLSVSDGAEVSPLRGVDCRSARIPSKISMRLNLDL